MDSPLTNKCFIIIKEETLFISNPQVKTGMHNTITNYRNGKVTCRNTISLIHNNNFIREQPIGQYPEQHMQQHPEQLYSYYLFILLLNPIFNPDELTSKFPSMTLPWEEDSQER